MPTRPGTGRTSFVVRRRDPVEDEAQLGNPLHLDCVGEARPEEGGRAFERTLDGADPGTLGTAQDEVDARMAVVHGQHDGDDPHSGERRIMDVVTKKRTKLIENKTLHTQMPMAGTLIFFAHDTAPGRQRRRREDFTLHSAAWPGPSWDEAVLAVTSGDARGTGFRNRGTRGHDKMSVDFVGSGVTMTACPGFHPSPLASVAMSSVKVPELGTTFPPGAPVLPAV
jgi:hypothetical protein